MSPRAFVPREAITQSIDTGSPVIQQTAKLLTEKLIAKIGMCDAIGVLSVSLVRAFIDLLHTESPMPEANIEAIHTLIANIEKHVLAHEECHKQLTAALKAQATGEPLEDVKPSIH